ncbi:MAG: hypothetical protein A2Y17_07535 [Clostridiales bacterium GWF2_38_85]|nr:MAG: hypothetical protein A2Y17_07535 [Clostridiales bacterium GWF2_38_85]HBL84274.1 hypothetical protein [Clostridiales bacterium]
MNTDAIMSLVHNVALLLALSIVYEMSNSFFKNKKHKRILFSSIFISLITLALMSTPYVLEEGITFDTRSILISVTALVFGTIPSITTAVVAVAFRINMGGVGTITGVSVIICSMLIGLFWRHCLIKKCRKNRTVCIYLMGFAVHIVMLACMFLMPYENAMNSIENIGLPVILMYPVGTVFLATLLFHQKDRNKATEKIKEAEERYSTIFNNYHTVMFLLDPDDGRLIDVNPAACVFYGYAREEMLQMTIYQINTLTNNDIENALSNAVRFKRNYFIFKHKKASGEIIDVEVFSGPITFRNKKLIYSMVHDITERIAFEKELRESEERFRSVVESSPDGIFIQTNRNFTYVNNASVKLFGAESSDQLLGMRVFDRFHPDYHEEIQKRITQLNDEKIVVTPMEEVFVKLNGDCVDVDVTAVPIYYNGQNGALVFARDISERKAMQQRQIEIDAQMRQQQKLEAIGTLAGGVAHEINNPINGIMNYAQLICDDVDENSIANKYSTEIIKETKRISTIVRNLLQFSRHEKQSHSYASIYDIIENTLSLIRTIIKKDQIQINVEIEENLPDIKCRSQQIQQVLMNLLTNARDALNEKYPEYNMNKQIIIKCLMFESESRRWMKISITDHGNGIPKVIKDKIFEPFFSTKPKELGTGLGLSISFGIIKEHHGSITVDTKKGEYTTFIIVLPIDNGWNKE